VGNAIEIRDPTTGALLRKLDAGDEILALAFSVDGRWLFTAHRDVPRITAWQIADGVEVAHLDMDSQAQRLLPLADPDLLLVQGRGNALRVWRLATGKEEHRFAHTSTVDHMAVALTAERAVTSQAASLRVWETRTGTEVAHRVSQGDIKSLAISADGRWVAYAIDQPRQNETGNTTKVLAVWEPESDRTPRLLPAPSFIHTMQFDARSRHLAVQFGGTAISVWEVNSLRSVATFQPLPDSTITEMMFSPDDERLLVEEYGRSSRRHSLRVWDMREQRELARVDVGGSVLQVSGSASIMTRDPQGVWHAWSPHTAGVAATAGPVGSVRWLGREPSHGRLTYVHDSGAVSVLDVDSGGHTQIVPPLPNVLVDTVAMAHSTDHVAMGVRLRADAAHASSVAIVYDAATATPVARLAHDGSIARLLFVTRDERLVTVSQMAATDTFSNRLRLWQWRSGDNIALSTDNPINAIAASPDGMIFATAEGQVDVDAQPLKEVGALQARLWDASTGKELRRLPHAQPVFDVAFSPDGRLLATRSNFEILIFRVADGVQLTSFQMEHGLAGGQVSFAAAGQYVSANVRHGIRVWATDGTASRLLRHEKEWPRFTISGDGIYVATATTNVRVWHIPSGAELAHTPLPSVWHLAFAGQHDALIVDTGKRLVQVLWRAEDLMTEACSRLGRNMTQEEWERFFDITPYRASCAHRATGKR
jgi:WD40 repeat protein